MMKLATVRTDKYQDLSKGELQQQLVKRDSKAHQERFMDQLTEAKLLRMGSAAGAAILTGLLYERKPGMESLFGSPVSVDHLLALGGGFAAFFVDDDDYAQVAEGIANVGLVPLFRSMGRKVGGAFG